MTRSGKTWAETAKALGVSTPAMSQWKTKKTKPSKKAIFRLEEAERAAGITPPLNPVESSNSQPLPVPLGSKEKLNISHGVTVDAKDVRSALKAAKELVVALEKILGGEM